MNSLELAADKMAIMDVVYKYCRAIDRLDRELLNQFFMKIQFIITENIRDHLNNFAILLLIYYQQWSILNIL